MLTPIKGATHTQGLCVSLLLLLSIILEGCGAATTTTTPSSSSASCVALTGNAWVPAVPGVAPSNHDASVTLSQSVINTIGPVVALNQPVPLGKEIPVSIDMTEDLGQYGSLTLMAQTVNFPASLGGDAFAYLVSLNDGVNELVNLSRAGTGNDCAAKGYYTCNGGSCSVNSSCTINSPSAFFNRNNWEQHQGAGNSAVNNPSINIFPTCNWAGGSTGSTSSPACGFNSTFFPTSPPIAATPKRLRYGTTYTARYALLSDSWASPLSDTSGLKVTVVKKTSTRSTPGGATDINIILVGNSNINASRTAKGQQNLNTLLNDVAEHFKQTGTGVGIGKVNAIEWPCSTGGENYSNPDVSVLGNLFAAGASVIPAGLDTKAINVFLVSTISDESYSNSNLTILGVDGAIGGPVMNGTAVSGMVVSTFDQLAKLNSNCPSAAATCILAQQDGDSFELSSTIAHEMGHFFGLNHLSESDGASHDAIIDTPICTATQTIGGTAYATLNACRTSDSNTFPINSKTCSADCGGSYNASSGTFCRDAISCQFNYLMWWTTKNFSSSTGSSDNNLFSTSQGGIINYHPIVQ
ncbi:MAG: M43 family zinc metalloprotease [Bdellovibrionia bacterium]